MATITAAMVKELRERTGSGMMECKKALTETGGDIEAAIELMRKNGQAKADKKADRAAAEGVLLIRNDDKFGVIVEVNCETDFVTKNQDFIDFSNKVADLAFEKKAANIDDMADITIDGTPLEEVRKNLIVKIGENITVRRVAGIHANGTIGAYAHGIRIAALVDVEG